MEEFSFFCFCFPDISFLMEVQFDSCNVGQFFFVCFPDPYFFHGSLVRVMEGSFLFSVLLI